MFFLFSIRLIHSPARLKAFGHASSTGYLAAKLGLCVAWILIGTLSSFRTRSMTLIGTDLAKSCETVFSSGGISGRASVREPRLGFDLWYETRPRHSRR